MKYINKGEINHKIAYIEFGDKPMKVMRNLAVAVEVTEGHKPRRVDYCNDWNDIGWIAQREGISVIYHKKFNMWEAAVDGYEAVHESPTVSMALCYLKMMGVSA